MATVNPVLSFKKSLEIMTHTNKPLGEEIPDTSLKNHRALIGLGIHPLIHFEYKMLIT